MPLPSSIRTATFHYKSASLRLQATFANLEKLKQATGQSPFDYIFGAMEVDQVDETMATLRTLFFCLQADSEPHSEAEIHDWLFGDFEDFFNEENMDTVTVVLGSIIGLDIKKKLEALAAEAAAAVAKDSEKADTKKK